MMKDPSISVIDHMIMSIAAKSIVHGDHARLNGLIEYLVPKKTIVEHEGKLTLEQLVTSTTDADKKDS